MKEIGGYFGMEKFDTKGEIHPNAIYLNSGRNAFEFILKNSNYEKVYLPYFTCAVMLQPLERLEIEHEFYEIDSQLLPKKKEIGENEALVYVNYFGIMDSHIQTLSISNLIIDNSQALYCNINSQFPSFYSPRKFFGFPDGGLAYLPNEKEAKATFDYDSSEDRISHLILRNEKGAQAGYAAFQENDAKLDSLPILNMSHYTRDLMSKVDYGLAQSIRLSNFEQYHLTLEVFNELSSTLNESDFEAPMVYPFLHPRGSELKRHLIENSIYVATYWPNVSEWADTESLEVTLQRNLVPLPLDHRWNTDDIQYVINHVVSFLNGG